MNWWITALESLLTGALGGTAIVLGLSRWLGNVWLEKQKAQYNKELEEFKNGLLEQQKRIQAKIDSSVFVTRAHFETEFAAMRELFSYLADVRLTMNTLRPTYGFSTGTKEEQLKLLSERYQIFSEAYNKLLKHQESLSPFYSTELYRASEKCVQAANLELVQVFTGNPLAFSQDWYKEGRENQKAFMQGYTETSVIIRDRLSKLAVLPTSL